MKSACLLAMLAVLAAVAVAFVPRATARERAATRAATVDAVVMSRLMGAIEAKRDEAWRWQRVMHRPRTPYSNSARRIRNVAYRKWVVRLWHLRAVKARQQAVNPPHREQWLCIHGHEGSWDDAGGPYYGGLQMDVGFQATYAPALLRRKGTADHWTPLEQMWVAERAFRTRGFWPWPNTARYCGLL